MHESHSNFKIGSTLSDAQKFFITIKTGYITGYETGCRNAEVQFITAKELITNAADNGGYFWKRSA